SRTSPASTFPAIASSSCTSPRGTRGRTSPTRSACSSTSRTSIPTAETSTAWTSESSAASRFSYSSRGAARPAHDVEQRLPPLVRDGRERALERRRQHGRVVHPLAVAARSGADLLEGRKLLEPDEGRRVAARRPAVRVHGERAALDRAP